jgi:multisubunit Na+/H+ antiporter MnhG subunit
MLDILIYILCYIGAAYTLMAVPCYIWHNRSHSFEASYLSLTFFITAPLTWPIFALGMAIDGWVWVRDWVLKLTGRD